jgi:gentisate 1,2-dioxygenase
VVYVIEGHGKTCIGETEVIWGPRDLFVLPTWAWIEHQNNSLTSEALLFSVSDAPLLEAAHLYREEPKSTVRVDSVSEIKKEK